MGCVSTKTLEEYKERTDFEIQLLKSQNKIFQTEIQTIVSNINDQRLREFNDFKTSITISRNIRNRKIDELERRLQYLDRIINDSVPK